MQQEGDRIGLIRKSNGHLHYYINGEDQGVASNETPPTIWGVVDLYGMAVKVSILDRNDPNYPNNISSPAQRARNIFRLKSFGLHESKIAFDYTLSETLCSFNPLPIHKFLQISVQLFMLI